MESQTVEHNLATEHALSAISDFLTSKRYRIRVPMQSSKLARKP